MHAASELPGPTGRRPDRTASRALLGERLVLAGLLQPEQLDQALTLQKRWKSRFGDVILAHRWMGAMQFYQSLAEHFGLDYVNLIEQAPEVWYEPDMLQDYTQRLALPWRMQNDQLVVAVADPCKEFFDWAHEVWGPDVLFVGTSKYDILWTLQSTAEPQLTHQALTLLEDNAPEHSARRVITTGQVHWFYALASLLLLALVLYPVPALITLNLLVTLGFLATFGFKWLLVWYGARHNIDIKVSEEELRQLDDEELPT
jgi:glycosyltransferase XagB